MVKLIDILKEIILEDRCKRIADRKFDKPSAYKSGAIVRCRKGNIWKGLKEDQKPSEELFNQAIQDIKPIIPQISHDIIHRKNLEHNEENMVKTNKELLKKVYAGDDYILDRLWDLAGNSLLRNAVNIITAYTANKLNEASTSTEVKDFLTDFGTLISLNFSQITKMGKDENATKELTLMMQQLRKPIINGKNYFDFLKDNINNIPSNPKLLSSILGIIRGFLIYIEPRIEQFVTDKPAPNGINYKEEWLKRINNIKNSYKKIVTEELTESQKETLRTWFKRKGAPGKTGGWVDCNTCRNGKCKPCGRQKGEKRAKYPSCRPTPAQCKTPGKGKKWGKTK